MSLQLICVNYGNVWDAIKVLAHSEKLKHFTTKTLVHPNPVYNLQTMQVPISFPDIIVKKAQAENQNEEWIKNVPGYIECDHALSIHWDGFIVSPAKWDDEYLNYDWIGAPWPLTNLPNPNWRVGSGGFFMFSKRIAQAWRSICRLDEPFDWQVGALYRDKFEAMGMKFAPVELAAKFCKECDLEDMNIPEGESWGFHGFQYGNGHREKYRDMVYSKK